MGPTVETDEADAEYRRAAHQRRCHRRLQTMVRPMALQMEPPPRPHETFVSAQPGRQYDLDQMPRRGADRDVNG